MSTTAYVSGKTIMSKLPIFWLSRNPFEGLFNSKKLKMEPAHFEAALNGDVLKFPFCNIEREDLSDIFNKVSPSGNSLLHVASSAGQEEMTQLIARKFPFLINKKNSEGDTSLHLAVRAQKLNTVRILVHLANQFPNASTDHSLLTMKNDEGNTALHEALFAILASKKNVNILVDVACHLVLHDPNVSCHQNDAGKSPLCLAVESSNKEILEYILNALPNGDGLLQRLEGKSPVHVAIMHKKLDMLRIIKEQKDELLLLRDEEGNTPLHLAAYEGYIKGVRYLLEIRSNWAFERNNKGLYPLHLACENGHIQVVKELFRKWPDPTELLCNEGQSILHVAAKNKNDTVIRFILNERGMDKLVNKRDKIGNTPFHLAALHGHSMPVITLLFDKRTKVDLVNYQGLTAYDIFKSNIHTKDQRTEVNDQNPNASRNVDDNSAEVELNTTEKPNQFQMMMTYSVLQVYHKFWPITHSPYGSTKKSQIKSKLPIPRQDLKNTINILFVVAALIVGAAFAGSLQISFDDGNGTVNQDVLCSFLSSNVVTMSLSITAALFLFLALLLDNNLTSVLVSIAFVLLELALTCMGSAFFYAMMSRVQLVKNLRCRYLDERLTIYRNIQLFLYMILSVAFVLGREVFSLIIHFLLFCIYFLLYRLGSMIHFNLFKAFIIFLLFVSACWLIGNVIAASS